MENKCLVCDTTILKVKRQIKQKRDGYELYKCPQCDLEWWEPRKMLPHLYEDEILPGYGWLHQEENFSLLENHKEFLRNFPLKNGKLLDVGCSSGSFLWHAEKNGFEVYGIDFDAKAVHLAREKGLSNVHSMSLDKFVELSEHKKIKYDVVTFFDVLEHQSDPRIFLQKISTLLGTGGYVAGSMPNKNRGLKKMLAHYLGDTPPHHFTHWSAETLRFLLEGLGFENICIKILPISVGELKRFFEFHVFGGMVKNMRRQVLSSISRQDANGVSLGDIKSNERSLVKKTILNILMALKESMFFFMGACARVFFIKPQKGPMLYFYAKWNYE